MIISGTTKIQQLFFHGDRVYRVYHGENMIYNCYATPSATNVHILGTSNQIIVHSNTEYTIR